MSRATLARPADRQAPPRRSPAKDLVRRFYDELLAGHGVEAIDELIAPDARISLPTGRFHGPEAVKRAIAQFGIAFGNLRVEVTSIIAEGDRVAAEWTMCGTEEGELLGVPPSGRWTCLSGLSLSRIEGGRIVEHRMIEG